MLRRVLDKDANTQRKACTNTLIPSLTSCVFAVVFVVFPLVFERQLVTQGGGERQQARSPSPRWQRGLEAGRVGREWDGDCVAVG